MPNSISVFDKRTNYFDLNFRIGVVCYSQRLVHMVILETMHLSMYNEEEQIAKLPKKPLCYTRFNIKFYLKRVTQKEPQ